MGSCIRSVELQSTLLRRCCKATHTVQQWTGGASALCFLRCSMDWWVQLKSSFSFLSYFQYLHLCPFLCCFSKPPFYSHSKAEMFENILHAPLQLHSGASQAARSLLEGLLERHVSKRLGGSHDLVSVQQAMMHINTPNHSGSNFSVYPGGAAGTFFLCIHQLERPPSQEKYPPVHPKSGKSDSEVSREHFLYQCTVCVHSSLISRLVHVMSATSTQSSPYNLSPPLWMRGGKGVQPAQPSQDSPSWTQWSMWFRNNTKSSGNMFL